MHRKLNITIKGSHKTHWVKMVLGKLQKIIKLYGEMYLFSSVAQTYQCYYQTWAVLHTSL